MRTLSLCMIVPALALGACNSSRDSDQAAAAAAVPQQQAAAAPAAQPPTQETVFVIGGGPQVSVGSLTEIRFDNPYEGLTFDSLRRTGPGTWETSTGVSLRKTTETANGFVLEDDFLQIVVDLALADVQINLGEPGSATTVYGPYNILLAR